MNQSEVLVGATHLTFLLERCDSFCAREAEKIGLGSGFRTFPSSKITKIQSSPKIWHYIFDEGLNEIRGVESQQPKNSYNDNPVEPYFYTVASGGEYKRFSLNPVLLEMDSGGHAPFLCLSNR
ncbi:hypothetical protein SAMN06265222_1083 [Neorhodopirellula lusitana]|uniref:Uncharacterized protein n=1 Tax=Neorhodopirellula lusitana TaxID=445327 RepID=A0ABY1Q8F6_9BACT|nr:hypothetical protein SAMN06265222_1083 [Neorhodopirellula lusitana]